LFSYFSPFHLHLHASYLRPPDFNQPIWTVLQFSHYAAMAKLTTNYLTWISSLLSV
jgi:hypothetical protein